MIFFGPTRWGAGPYTAHPVADCFYCHEPIVADDYGVGMPFVTESSAETVYQHRECFLRGIFGSVGHQLTECSCYGGNMEDPPHMTTRQAAKAAAELFEKKHRRRG